MGFSVRVFLLNERGEPQGFPYARFQRLSRHDPKESLPEYAGAHACFAIAYIVTLDGELSQIAHLEYPRLKMGPDGRIDREAVRRSLSLAAGSIDLPPLLPEPSKLLRAHHIFSRRQYQHEFCWKPSLVQEQGLLCVFR
jgi:hypothetical protein